MDVKRAGIDEASMEYASIEFQGRLAKTVIHQLQTSQGRFVRATSEQRRVDQGATQQSISELPQRHQENQRSTEGYFQEIRQAVRGLGASYQHTDLRLNEQDQLRLHDRGRIHLLETRDVGVVNTTLLC